MTRRNCSPTATAGSASLRNQSNSTRRTGEGMNLAIEMDAFTAMTVRSLPPCGGEPERGVSPGFGVRGLLLSLALPRKGGGNAAAFADGSVVLTGSFA
jgi:hypothetical protein